ncbi:D-alanyl-D-alanine carboxypeptidase [Streptomyces pseudoechinosporeus]
MTAEGSPGREGSAAASEAEDAAESGANGSQSSQAGDTRLRDAVAAWVAGADAGAEGAGSDSDSGSGDRESRAGAESDGGIEGDGDAAPSADDGTAPEAAADTEEARTDSEAGSDSEPEDAVAMEGTSGTVEAKDDRSAGDAEAEAAEEAERSEAKPEDGADARSDAEPSGEDTPAGSRGSGADEAEADAASGADGDASGEDVSTDAEGDDPAGGSGAEPSAEGAVAGGRSDDVDEPKADAPPGGEAASAAAPGTGAESGSSVAVDGATADAEDDRPAGGPDAEPSAEEAPAPGRTAEADEPKADATPGGEAALASGADAKSESESGRDGDAESGSASGPDPDAKRDPRVSSGNVPAADRDDDGEPEPSSSAGEDEPKRPVDQPTATFKVRAPAVDQPTTTLKVGDAKPDEKPAGPEPDDKQDEKPTSERDSERTSKFVALKPLDEPAPPKEKPALPPAAEKTAAIPQVGPERTAQQPLPPKPPLDLLAELTNTPPPPETPVRTIVRRVKIWTPLAVLLAVVFAVVQAVRPLPAPALALTADETYTFEGDKVTLPWPAEGQGWMDVNGIGTVDNFGEQQPVAIGSVAKAMVAYVILKDHPLKPGEEGKNIPVDAKAETEGGYDKDGESTLNTIKEGDTLTQRQALAAIMIPSANNVARLLARWDAGSEAAFVKKMNDAAKDLGMKNTKYTDPSGLKETTVSSAEDQVKLGNELVQMKALTDITKLPTWKDPSGKEWQNYNRLVPYDNAIGIKTGSTTKAGGNLLFAATEDVDGEIVTVVGAILGQHQPPIIDTVNAVSKTAMVAAQDALTSSTILKKGDVVGYVDDGFGGRTRVVATQDVSAVGWAGKTVELTLSDDGTEIPHEAKAGTKVGSLSVGDGTGDAVEVPVALQSDLTEPGYGSKLTRVS